MLDFMSLERRIVSKDRKVYYRPTFLIKKSSDLMIRGHAFYAIWDEENGLWSTDQFRAIDMIDKETLRLSALEEEPGEAQLANRASTKVIDDWNHYCTKQMTDSYKDLDDKLVWLNDPINKKDYASKRLPYSLAPGNYDAFEEIISTLYSPSERHKLEWTIGCIVAGDSKNIQKFVVMYGSAGTGKSTILNIIDKLFEGHTAMFDAKALGSNNNSFALEMFKSNPLVAIQHDGDLSKIEDNTKLNSLVSHERMTVNEKFKTAYETKFRSFLYMGTNRPVRITDSKSGLLRRLIDVTPSGNRLAPGRYAELMKKIEFELGAIAWHCREVYLENPNYYNTYVPTGMLSATNDMYDFVADHYSTFLTNNSTTLSAAWELYKTYAEDTKVPFPLTRRTFKEELKAYFDEFEERHATSTGERIRGYYHGFRPDKFENPDVVDEVHTPTLINLEPRDSIFDSEMYDCPAQYATADEKPTKKWENVTTTLADIDTSKVHYVKVPQNHIVIDFDLKDKDGKKDPIRNLTEASKWPATYAELSKGGAGIHLHYIYDGDVDKLSRLYAEDIEIKVFKGGSSLRRKLTKCNNHPIATISSGLPLKEENKVVNFESIKNEKGLRTLIRKNLNKEIHPGTKPSIDFIYKILEDAYNDGLHYDVRDMQAEVIAFASQSTHQAPYCLALCNKMKFVSEEATPADECGEDSPIIFFDCEVFPNLFLINWKPQGEGVPVVRMINPTPEEVEGLMRKKLVGFNCRRYDNHILYARHLGYTNEQLYELSKGIVNSDKSERSMLFGEAYNLSYTDIYEFASKKQSLKKWEIELGIHHQELSLPWDEPVDESMWHLVAEYCDNDVIATEAVWNHLQGDFLAREILADIAGMSVNDTTNSLTTRIIFGKEKHPDLVYTNLEETFPGYEFCSWPEYYEKYPEYMAGVDAKELERRLKDTFTRNLYRGTDLGFGGYVYAEPGMYQNIALLDVASLHPHSIKAMNCFGEYTKNFTDIMDARIFIKHGDYESARQLFDGKLAKYLDDPSTAKQLAQALKIAINSVYGMTSATYDNPFRDPRNKNNIVALRGALFMRTLQDEVVSRGYTVAHIKTDSIKIPDATPEIIDFCMKFANKYGYDFEHEATYKKMCLVNNAVYIAQYQDCEHNGEWTATGAQFAVPYVFKTLFSHEPIVFEDLCEAKSASTSLYLDMNESNPNEHNRVYVGKVGQYCPIKPGKGGGLLVRRSKDKDKDGNDKFDSVTGAKDYRWLESEYVRMNHRENDIDMSYFNKLVDDAFDAIAKYGDAEWFIDEGDKCIPDTSVLMDLPWKMPCGRDSCADCPNLISKDLPYEIGCKEGHDNSCILAPMEDDGDAWNKR